MRTRVLTNAIAVLVVCTAQATTQELATRGPEPDRLGQVAAALGRPEPMRTRFRGWAAPPAVETTADLLMVSRAITQIERAAEDQLNGKSLAELGRLRAVQQRWGEALATLRRATTLEPSDTAVSHDLAAVEIHVGLIEDDPWLTLEGLARIWPQGGQTKQTADRRHNLDTGLVGLGLLELATRAPPAPASTQLDADVLRAQFFNAIAGIEPEPAAPPDAGSVRGPPKIAELLQQRGESLPQRTLDHLAVVGPAAQDRIISALQALLHWASSPYERCSRLHVAREAASAFREEGSPLVFEAERALAGCELLTDPTRAITSMNQWVETLSSGSLLSHSRALEIGALAQHRAGLLEASLASYGEAVELSQQVHSPSRSVVQLASLGAVASQLGRRRLAWSAQSEALKQSQQAQGYRETVLAGMEQFLHSSGFVGMSADLLHLLLQRQDQLGDRVYYGLALVERLLEASRTVEALTQLHVVEDLLNDPAASDWPEYRTKHLALKADIAVQEHGASASRDLLAEAVGIHAASRGQTADRDALDRRYARLELLDGRPAAALERMERVLATIQSHTPRENAEREQFLVLRRNDYALAMEAASHLPDALASFHLADRFRALRFEHHTAQQVDELKRQRTHLVNNLPSDVLVLSWTVLPEKLLLHALSVAGIEQHQVWIDEHQLRGRVQAWRRLSPLDQRRLGLSRLGLDVLAPNNFLRTAWSAHINQRKSLEHADPTAPTRVVLVTDPLLEPLPMERLLDSLLPTDRATRYSRTTHLAPPSTESLEPRPNSVLAVGVSAGSQALAPLPHAKFEAEQAAQSTNSRLLLDEQATAEALKRIAPDFDTLYVAAHAGMDPASERAALWLARPEGGHTALTSTQIATDLNLGVPAVILSVCGNGGSRRLEQAHGSHELAVAFLRAGASSVHTTPYDLGDREAAVTLGFVTSKPRPIAVARQRSGDAKPAVGEWSLWLHPKTALQSPHGSIRKSAGQD